MRCVDRAARRASPRGSAGRRARRRAGARRRSAWTAERCARACLRRRARLAGRRPPLRRRRGAPRGSRGAWSNRRSSRRVPEIVVRDGRRAALVLGPAWYDHPGRRLTLVGVTGHQRQDHHDRPAPPSVQRRRRARAASVRSARSMAGASRSSSTAGTLTTPGPIDLQATLAELVARGVHRMSPWRRRPTAWTRAARRPARFAARRVHQSHPRSSRLPRDMEAYLAAKLKLSTLLRLERRRGGQSRRRRPGAPCRRGRRG